MGASNSREGTLSPSDSEDDPSTPPPKLRLASPDSHSFRSPSVLPLPSPSPSLMASDLSLASLSLNGPLTPSAPSVAAAAAAKQTAKLYRHIGGNTAKAQWVVSEKLVRWKFVRDRGSETYEDDDDDDDDDDEQDDDNDESDSPGSDGRFRSWNLQVGKNVKARVGSCLQMKYFDEQLRVDFVHKGVWALKFFTLEDYKDFVTEFLNCTFENTYLLEATEENKMKVFGKDFMDWANPNAKADESIWEDAEDGDFERDPSLGKKDLKEAFNETSSGGIQSLVMGALDHSFLVSDNGIEAVKNMASGVRGKGNTVKYESTMVGVGSNSTPRKAMLMRGEMNMMLLSPAVDNLHSSGVHQLDLPTGKVVAEWKFEKDGTPITMLDMTNESKGSQLDTSESTFLGLDDNRLCRWDMRDRHGIVQDISTPVLNWADGHQFSRGTNFQCFATTGDGFVAVGSKDGKVRLYGNSSMRMAKTAFPGLGSPITHIDVTFDGKWVLATSDSYLILISTMFKDKDGRIKTGFSGRGGNKFAPPRLLKLTPLDAHLAGPDNKLRNGQFSWVTESGKHERHLVATAGKFSVIWNFQRVKEGNESHECYRNAKGFKCCYCYKVVLREVSVVDSKFMHDKFTVDASPDEAPLVVATPNKVSSFNMWRD